MFRSLVFLILTPLMLPQSNSTNPLHLPKPYTVPEAYEVYAAVLPSEWPWPEAQKLVIQLETKQQPMCLQPEKESEAVVGPAIADYLKQNETTWLLQRQFDIEKPYELVSRNELEATFQSGGWTLFYQQHPKSGGIIEMSAVGFNVGKTVAVVDLGHGCGRTGAGGMLHVLQKKDGKWVPLYWKGVRCAWAS